MSKVTVIAQIDPFGFKMGGTKHYVMNFIKSVDSNVKVSLFGYTTQKNKDMKIKENIEFYALDLYKEEKLKYFFPQTFRFILKLYKNRVKILRKGKVLHIHRLDHSIPFLFPIKKGKIIQYFHGTASKGYLMGRDLKAKLRGAIYAVMELYVLTKVDKIITVSKNDERFYRNKYPKVKGKIVTIPPSVNLEIFNVEGNKKEMRRGFGLNEKDKIILYAGRYNWAKGIDLIIKSFTKLNKDYPNTSLILVGQGEDERRLHALVSKLGTKNVIFLKPIPHNEIPQILNSADVLVMASFTEGMPTILLEAIACGLPVVSTNVGNIHEIVKNERIGFLINNRDEEEFKNKLIKALAISDKFKEERVEAMKSYSSFNLSKKILEVNQCLTK